MAKEAMSEEMEAVQKVKVAKQAALEAAATGQRERERSSIATPGTRTPGTVLRRKQFGL
jgi:hypothetical protein